MGLQVDDDTGLQVDDDMGVQVDDDMVLKVDDDMGLQVDDDMGLQVVEYRTLEREADALVDEGATVAKHDDVTKKYNLNIIFVFYSNSGPRRCRMRPRYCCSPDSSS